MILIWWTGKGYLVAVIVLATFALFGIALPVGGGLLPDTPSYWGTAALVSAAADWFVGRRHNARAIIFSRSAHAPRQLIYRARHRFLSLPMEYWAAPLALAGATVIAYGLAAAR